MDAQKTTVPNLNGAAEETASKPNPVIIALERAVITATHSLEVANDGYDRVRRRWIVAQHNLSTATSTQEWANLGSDNAAAVARIDAIRTRLNLLSEVQQLVKEPDVVSALSTETLTDSEPNSESSTLRKFALALIDKVIKRPS